MKKGFFFKTGLVIAVLIALVTVGAIVAVKSIDTEQLKAMLTTQVEKNTGRVLAIDGPLTIKLGRITSYNVCYTKLLRNYIVITQTIFGIIPLWLSCRFPGGCVCRFR